MLEVMGMCVVNSYQCFARLNKPFMCCNCICAEQTVDICEQRRPFKQKTAQRA